MTPALDANKKFQKEINSGTSALVLLGIMGNSKDFMYGYQIAKMMETEDDQIPMMKQGALYPVLRSLESSGFLESYVDPSVSGPPRRYYRITPFGQKILAGWKEIWEHTKNFVDNILEGKSHDQTNR